MKAAARFDIRYSMRTPSGAGWEGDGAAGQRGLRGTVAEGGGQGARVTAKAVRWQEVGGGERQGGPKKKIRIKGE